MKRWINFTLISLLFCLKGYTENIEYPQDIKLEADYILNCQYIENSQNPAYGAINNVYGAPTWVVPGENAVAIMGLIEASKVLNDPLYIQRAEFTADYLVRIQDSDGGWYDQYNYATPVSGKGKSLRHTAEVMMAWGKLGYRSSRYDAMVKAANFILACQDPFNKGGEDDGLVGGGKKSDGSYHTWRWASDNAYAYHALRVASIWAKAAGENDKAKIYKDAALRIKEGLKNYLLSDSGDHWKRVVDEHHNSISGQTDKADWISYAPSMLDVDIESVDYKKVGDWIHNNLQKQDGALVWDNAEYSQRKSPGFSFQAILAWLDSNKEDEYAEDAMKWALESGLWQITKDANGIKGGWIDWINEDGTKAEWWQRFIDTSAYYIMAKNGGYDFSSYVVPEPTAFLLFLIGLFGLGVLKRRSI